MNLTGSDVYIPFGAGHKARTSYVCAELIEEATHASCTNSLVNKGSSSEFESFIVFR